MLMCSVRVAKYSILLYYIWVKRIQYTTVLFLAGRVQYTTVLYLCDRVKFTAVLCLGGRVHYNALLCLGGRVQYTAVLCLGGRVQYTALLCLCCRVQYTAVLCIGGSSVWELKLSRPASLPPQPKALYSLAISPSFNKMPSKAIGCLLPPGWIVNQKIQNNASSKGSYYLNDLKTLEVLKGHAARTPMEVESKLDNSQSLQFSTGAYMEGSRQSAVGLN